MIITIKKRSLKIPLHFIGKIGESSKGESISVKIHVVAMRRIRIISKLPTTIIRFLFGGDILVLNKRKLSRNKQSINNKVDIQLYNIVMVVMRCGGCAKSSCGAINSLK
jgi:hypothetical protein